MFSGGNRALRRGAERWERSARERRDSAPEDFGGALAEPLDEGGRHRAGPGQQTPWRQRPRARVISAPHQFYSMATFVIVVLLVGGTTAIVAGDSVWERVGGVLAVLGGAVLVWLAVLHLRRPVKR